MALAASKIVFHESLHQIDGRATQTYLDLKGQKPFLLFDLSESPKLGDAQLILDINECNLNVVVFRGRLSENRVMKIVCPSTVGLTRKAIRYNIRHVCALYVRTEKGWEFNNAFYIKKFFIMEENQDWITRKIMSWVKNGPWCYENFLDLCWEYVTFWEENGPWTYDAFIDLCMNVNIMPDPDGNLDLSDILSRTLEKFSLEELRKLLSNVKSGNREIDRACNSSVFNLLPLKRFNKEQLDVCKEFEDYIDISGVLSDLSWDEVCEILLKKK